MTLTRPAGAPHTRAARLTCTLLAAALLLAACATPQRQAEQLAAAGQHEAALALLRQQGAESSADIALRTAYLRQREATVTRLLAEADEARLAGQPERARAVLARIEAVAPAHPRTAAMRDALDRQQRQQRLTQQAREAFERGELDRAEAAARAVIDLEPGDAAARGLLNRITEQRADATRDALPLAAADKPVTLEFREAPLRTVFEALSRAAGVNFVFDKDVRGEMLVVVLLVGILASAAMPLAELQRRRAQESELREGLRSIRSAIDAYKRTWDEGRIEKRIDDSGYPPTLAALVEGVPDIKDPKGARIYFLRRLPRDPFADPLLPAAQSWQLRSYASPPDAPAPGKDVYDVMSGSPGTALDGSAYRDW